MSPRFSFKAVVSGMDCIRDAWSFLNISYSNQKNTHMYVYTYTGNFCFTRFCLFFIIFSSVVDLIILMFLQTP